MKKILVPIDFSDVSRYAAELAVDLAERSGAKVTFLHSIHFSYFSDFPHAIGLNIQPMIEEVKEAVDDNLKKFIDNLDTKADFETKISNLHLLEAVKDTVKEENVGLVILGTKGSSGWSEILVGSNTERIVRWVDCPVISVPCPTSYDKINKILIPIDLREIQDDFMDRLLRLQKLFSASMEFLWVKTPHNIENEEKVMEEFSDLTKKYGFKDTTFVIKHAVFPSDGILEESKELNADMIAMATHARRGISHWLSGSITEDTVNHIDVPVWTFKLSKDAKSIELNSFKNASGTPEYKKLEKLTV